MVRKALLAALAMLLLTLGVVAQSEPPISPQARLDEAKGAIDRIESGLTRGDLKDAELQSLRADIDPVTAQMDALAAELAPRVEAAKARLAQLGPKPDANATPEPPEVSTERGAQDKLFNDLDATVKRAKVLAVQAGQISDGIAARRRALFAHALFERAPSLLSPTLWLAVLKELPADTRAVRVLTEDFVTASWRKLDVWQKILLPSLVGLVILVSWPAWRLAVRVRSRDETAAPSRLGKALAALRVAVATAAVPTAAAFGIGGILDLFGLPMQFRQIGQAIGLGVGVVAVMTGLARGLMAPKSPNWRLPPISDIGARALYGAAIAISSVVAVEKVIEASNDVIAVALPTAVATRGLGAVGVVLVLLTSVRKGRKRMAAAKDFSPTAEMQHWAAVLRLLASIAIVVIVVAVAIGYVTLASFLVDQLIVVAGTLSLAYILVAIADHGFETLLDHKGAVGRGLTLTLGVQAGTLDQIAILLSGMSRLIIVMAAILLILSPWQIGSGDMLLTVQAAFFGFSVGDVRISISTIVVALLMFGAVLGATRALQSWLEAKYLPLTRLDAGLQNSIKTSLGYVGATIALGIGLSHVGLGLERLTLVAGGLSVGIGLGLQTVTNNFVSGLILLWERAIRVGDRISVGSEQGYVRRINVRSTEIETFDRALVVMPNSSLISGIVKNWVRNDRIGRITLPFGVPLTSDPEEIRGMLIQTGKAHDLVLAIPTPQVFFVSMTDTQIKFELICYVEDVESAARVTSDLLFEIHEKFRAAGLIQPAAVPTVTSPALDKLDAWLSAKVGQATDGSAVSR